VAGPVELLLLDGGHSPHLEHPDAVAAAIAGFLAGLSR
jgi:pimeloyl-ACP methyl ester carboxylesterase